MEQGWREEQTKEWSAALHGYSSELAEHTKEATEWRAELDHWQGELNSWWEQASVAIGGNADGSVDDCECR